MRLTLGLSLALAGASVLEAFVARPAPSSCRRSAAAALAAAPSSAAAAATTDAELRSQVQASLDLLYRAAETKQEDSDAVYGALSDLEKDMRQLARQDETVATDMLSQLRGDWRLVFTTGTAKTQQKFGKINYFPLKAVQSFRPEERAIENGIYAGDFAVVKFRGAMDFDPRKRRLEFDFDTLYLFNGWLAIPLKKGEAASLGAKSGLGSEGNVANAARDKLPFFNWISADDKIATARGGGGGLALWKRIG